MLAYRFVGIKGQKECSKQLVVSISVCFFFHQVCVFCVCYFLFPPLFLQQKSPRNHKWAEFFAEGPVRTYVPSWSYAIWWPGDSVTEAIHLKMVQRFLNRLSSLKYFILFFLLLLVPFHSYRWLCSWIVVARNITDVSCPQLLYFIYTGLLC